MLELWLKWAKATKQYGVENAKLNVTLALLFSFIFDLKFQNMFTKTRPKKGILD